MTRYPVMVTVAGGGIFVTLDIVTAAQDKLEWFVRGELNRAGIYAHPDQQLRTLERAQKAIGNAIKIMNDRWPRREM